MRKALSALAGLAALFGVLVGAGPAAASGAPTGPWTCDQNSPFCTEPNDPYSPAGNYIGHDEPSVLFYDSRPGAGYDVTYRIRLPKEPGTQPTQDGTNGYAWSFEQRSAFWFGMIMCDTESAPEYTHT